MYRIILDCDLMRYRNSGLYHYCLNLGEYVKNELERSQKGRISFYVPEAEKSIFSKNSDCIIEKRWHQQLFRPFLSTCDIWHSPFQSGRVLPAGNKRIRSVLTIHDLNCLHEGKSQKEQHESLHKTQKLIDQSHAVICISNHCKKDVMENLDVKEKPVYVIHNGTHHVIDAPGSPDGYVPVRPFLFSMGYVNQKKNFHTLVPLLADRNVELVIAGKLDDPDYVGKMRKLAADLGVSDLLHILGPVSENSKAWYLKNCTAFMMPSLAEGFGAPVVEAMKFGKPLFLSGRTSLPEIGGDVAFYFNTFEPGNMQQVFKEGMAIYRQNGLAASIMERGRAFDWEKSAKAYVSVYDSLL